MAQGEPDHALDLFNRAMAISRETGVGYCGPLIQASTARAARDPAESDHAIAKGKALLTRGCLSHNHLEFHPAIMILMNETRNWERGEGFAAALEDYTSAEPLPRATFFIESERAMAAIGRGERSTDLSQRPSTLMGEAKNAQLTVGCARFERCKLDLLTAEQLRARQPLS